MSKACSTCGQRYPDNFFTCTCRFCGGVIEDDKNDLDPREFYWQTQWQAWQELYKATPPRPLRDDDWYITCGYFNHCCICGGSIDEKLLIIPPYLGGKLYRHNVLPACETCAKRVRQSQRLNPLKSLFTVTGSVDSFVSRGLRYLEALMLGVEFVDFDFDNDALEITIVCTEDTSADKFTGIYAKRIFDKPKIGVDFRTKLILDRPEEYEGVTWRLI